MARVKHAYDKGRCKTTRGMKCAETYYNKQFMMAYREWKRYGDIAVLGTRWSVADFEQKEKVATIIDREKEEAVRKAKRKEIAMFVLCAVICAVPFVMAGALAGFFLTAFGVWIVEETIKCM